MGYTFDWSTSNLSGDDNNLDDGEGNSVTATVTRSSGDGRFHDSSNPPGDMPSGVLVSDLVEDNFDGGQDTPYVTVNFSSEVSNISFTLYDVDQGRSGDYTWDELVGIKALDSSGNVMPVLITATGGQSFTLIPDENGFYYVEGEVQDDLELGSVTVTIAGPVSELTINFTDGPDDIDTGHDDTSDDAGWIGVSDLVFDDYCFVRGTLIETKHGDVLIEDLVAGDLIRTLDNGFQPIRWIGSSKAPAMGGRAPVLFKKGAIGNSRDLYVSPWHRIRVSGWNAELLFGDSELLVAAKFLVNDCTVLRAQAVGVEYFHVMFDRHEIIFSNGAATESFHPGEANLDTMAQKTRQEVLGLFPELENNKDEFGPTARPILHAHEATLLAG